MRILSQFGVVFPFSLPDLAQAKSVLEFSSVCSFEAKEEVKEKKKTNTSKSQEQSRKPLEKWHKYGLVHGSYRRCYSE